MSDERARALYVVRQSHIHGRGVFAARRIRKGTRIVEYTGERIDNDEADRRYDDTQHEAPPHLPVHARQEYVHRRRDPPAAATPASSTTPASRTARQSSPGRKIFIHARADDRARRGACLRLPVRAHRRKRRGAGEVLLLQMRRGQLPGQHHEAAKEEGTRAAGKRAKPGAGDRRPPYGSGRRVARLWTSAVRGSYGEDVKKNLEYLHASRFTRTRAHVRGWLPPPRRRTPSRCRQSRSIPPTSIAPSPPAPTSTSSPTAAGSSHIPFRRRISGWGSFDRAAARTTRATCSRSSAAPPPMATSKATADMQEARHLLLVVHGFGGAERAGHQPIAPELDRIAAIKTTARSSKPEIARLHSQGVPALFGFGSEQDAKNSTVGIAGIRQGGLVAARPRLLSEHGQALRRHPRQLSGSRRHACSSSLGETLRRQAATDAQTSHGHRDGAGQARR